MLFFYQRCVLYISNVATNTEQEKNVNIPLFCRSRNRETHTDDQKKTMGPICFCTWINKNSGVDNSLVAIFFVVKLFCWYSRFFFVFFLVFFSLLFVRSRARIRHLKHLNIVLLPPFILNSVCACHHSFHRALYAWMSNQTASLFYSFVPTKC